MYPLQEQSNESNSIMSRKIINSTPVQKFCKVCQDAGKSETEYRSHFTRETRDPNSRVICPTLLSLECRYCFKQGHTVKYCKVLKEKDAASRTVSNTVEKSKKPEEKPKGKIYTNIFNVLDDADSGDESPVTEMPVKQVTEDFPPLAPSLIRTQTVSGSYAAALTKPTVNPVPIPVTVKAPEVKAAPWASNAPKPTFKMKSWADSDSESESDEEDNIDWKLVLKNDDWY